MTPAEQEKLYAKIGRRVLPPLFCGWVIAYVDNLNVGFAQLQMRSDIGLSDAAFGFGASLALIGSILLQLPSNLLMQRIGASWTATRILVAWFLVSVAMTLVRSAEHYLLVRLMTGILTAGLWTGILYYLTIWFPDQRRAQMLSVFLLAPVLAAVLVGPISGVILARANGVLGLQGWQWMFLLESLPALFTALWVWRCLPDTPEAADFLTPTEKSQIIGNLEAHPEGASNLGWRRTIIDRRTLVLGMINAVASFAIFLLNFFGPTLIHELGTGDLTATGWLFALPYFVGGAFMIFWSRHSDRTGERRWHYFLSIAIAAAGFMLLASANSLTVGMLGMTLAVSGLLSSIPVFWAIPAAIFPSSAAAAGLAVVNMIGDAGGALSPSIVGMIRTYHGPLDSALYGLAVFLMFSAAIVFVIPPNFPGGAEKKERSFS